MYCGLPRNLTENTISSQIRKQFRAYVDPSTWYLSLCEWPARISTLSVVKKYYQSHYRVVAVLFVTLNSQSPRHTLNTCTSFTLHRENDHFCHICHLFRFISEFLHYLRTTLSLYLRLAISPCRLSPEFNIFALLCPAMVYTIIYYTWKAYLSKILIWFFKYFVNVMFSNCIVRS